MAKKGIKRRKSEELRSDFLHSAAKSLDEIKYSVKRPIIRNVYLSEPTNVISKALTIKWALTESQKNIIELCGVLSVGTWFYFRNPEASEVVALTAVFLLLYRLSPLVIQMTNAYQSLTYGKSSANKPNKTVNPVNFSIIEKNKNLKIIFRKKTIKLNLKKNGLIS